MRALHGRTHSRSALRRARGLRPHVLARRPGRGPPAVKSFLADMVEDAPLEPDEQRRRRRPAAGWESLTDAELDVVRLVAEGLTNPEIAARLFVSPRTVQTHLGHIFAEPRPLPPRRGRRRDGTTAGLTAEKIRQIADVRPARTPYGQRPDQDPTKGASLVHHRLREASSAKRSASPLYPRPRSLLRHRHRRTVKAAGRRRQPCSAHSTHRATSRSAKASAAPAPRPLRPLTQRLGCSGTSSAR